MNITKYQHACFVLEADGRQLIVDPGSFSHDFETPTGVVAVVVTHVHGDHFDSDKLVAINKLNPNVTIYAPADVIDKLPTGVNGKAVSAGSYEQIGPFALEFFGSTHAVIHPDIPVDQNVGVMINGVLYYPGDSYTLPEKPVTMLALPIAAPWLKISEAIDFMIAVQPNRIFPTHDEILSEDGRHITDAIIMRFTGQIGATYQRIQGSIAIDG